MGFSFIPFLLFGLFALTPMLTNSGSAEDEDPETPDEDLPTDETPVDEPPADPATLGATFASNADGITIEFGENETGSLAVFTYVDTQDDPDSFIGTHEARYYLVPEGVEFPDNTSETSFNIPGSDQFDGPDTQYQLEDLEDVFGLTLLGTYDLLAEGNDTPTDTNMADALPELTANRDAEYYYIESNTDGDALIEFLQEGFLVTSNGVPETVVSESTTGSETSDWFSTQVDGLTLAGAEGDDTLGGTGENLVLDGGAGDDLIDAQGIGATIVGGAGEDVITANAGGAFIDSGEGDDTIRASDADVFGGAGNDSVDLQGGTADGGIGNDDLTSFGDSATMFGGEGDDRLYGNSTGSDFFGGEGNDFVGVEAGSTAYGGAGEDLLQIGAGGTGFGDDGDDTIRVWDFYGEDSGAATVTGGAGADVFDISIRNAFGEAADDVFTEITDFDPDEDMLMIGNVFSGPAVDSVTVTEDPNGGFSDVEIFFEVADGQTVAVSTIVRLTGVTGLDPDQIVLQ